MSIFRKLGLIGSLSTLAIAGVISCGGGQNNDQGTSFTALGFVTDDLALLPDHGREVTLNQDVPAPASSRTALLAFANNLCQQTIRLVRVDCDYSIPGADPGFVIPSDSTNTSVIMSAGPACPGSESSSSSSSSVSPVPVGQTNEAVARIDLLSTDLLSYISVNQAMLPELPFRMTATCRGIAVSQSGDVFYSEDINYPVEFVDQAVCCTGTGTTPGYQTGAGTGGTPLTGTSSSSVSSAASAFVVN